MSREGSFGFMTRFGILMIPAHSRYDDSSKSIQELSSILNLPQAERVKVPANGVAAAELHCQTQSARHSVEGLNPSSHTIPFFEEMLVRVAP